MVRIQLVRILAVCGLLWAGSAATDTCPCQAPCSGSITCAGGCYAFCEENPENSGRHVCVKGCSDDNNGSAAQTDTTTLPAEDSKPNAGDTPQ
jgi:hypothetical protein